MTGDTDEELDEETRERVDRVRGKRDSRPSRRRSRRDAETEQTPQTEQEEQAEQEKAQRDDTMNENIETATGNGSENAQPEQAPQTEQGEQAPVAKLDPVTQRRHDTYYLSEAVTDELERAYRRMSLDVLEETGVDLDNQRVGGRNRYFRPLALLLGARQIADMSPSELRETIEEENLLDDLPESE